MEESQIYELNAKIIYLLAWNQYVLARINDLTEEVEDIKREKLAVSKDNNLKCAQCDYSASTSTVLNGHISMKHKNSAKRIKILC